MGVYCMSAATFHEFDVDRALVSDLIHSQNGTIATAIRELVMNSIDAGSSTVDITLTRKGFEVADRGTGFQSEEDVLRFYKRFGTPHQEGDALFGRFRIGRGQIMAFGPITWHSNEFKMITDVRAKGNGFDFVVDKTDVFKGCTVKGSFYEPLDEWRLEDVRRDITKLVRYTEQRVTFNGVVLNDQSDIEWDFEDEELRIKWNPVGSHQINLYSLGVFVKELARYNYGISADIVTKSALKLNMARNEINDNDGLWLKIDKLLKKKSREEAAKQSQSSRMEEDTRLSMIRQFKAGQLSYSEALSMHLFQDIRGHGIRAERVFNGDLPITIDDGNHGRVADRIATTKVAFVLHSTELRTWEVTALDELQTALVKAAKLSKINQLVAQMEALTFVPLSELAQDVSSHHEILEDKTLTPKHQAALNALRVGSRAMADKLISQKGSFIRNRKIHIGISQTAEGWTDSESYIAINKDLLKNFSRGIPGTAYLASVMLHEYNHDKESLSSHEHGFEFYEGFHDTAINSSHEIIGYVGQMMFEEYLRQLSRRLIKLPKAAFRPFQAPIINDLKTVEVHRSGERLSDLAKWMLESSKMEVTYGNKKLTCNVNASKCGLLGQKLQTKLTRLMNKAGIEILTEKQFGAIHSGSGINLRKAYKDKFREALVRFFEQTGQDMTLIDRVLDLRGLDEFLLILTSDRNSDLESFSYSYFGTNVVTGSGKHQAVLSRRDSQLFHSWSNRNKLDAAQVLGSQKSQRFEYARKKLLEVANMFTDEVEREEFCQQFLNETTMKQVLES